MKNERGFTLLSMMMALALMTVVLFLAASVIASLAHRFEDNFGFRKELSLFFSQTSREMHLSHGVTCDANGRQMTLDKGFEKVSFKASWRNRVVRQVGGAGYDIVLQHAASVRFQCRGETAAIEVVDDQNRTYYWIDRLYIKEGGDENEKP
ncbi:competence protein ComGF [Sporolactobacillus sp. THM7-7]|nr:competence protein ComGF [Sporolactobacillus sp. THM7-7]